VSVLRRAKSVADAVAYSPAAIVTRVPIERPVPGDCIVVTLQFFQPCRRTVEPFSGEGCTDFDDAIARKIVVEFPPAHGEASFAVDVPAVDETGELRDDDGTACGRIARRAQRLRAALHVSADYEDDGRAYLDVRLHALREAFDGLKIHVERR